MKVIKRKRCILNHRGRIRSSKFPLSRYCGCVTESFVGCVRFVFSIACLFVFVVSSKIMKWKTLSLIPSLYRVWGCENSRNLFKPETPTRVCVTVTNSTNTPRPYCVKQDVYRPLQGSIQFPSKLQKLVDKGFLKKFVSSNEEKKKCL